ncbi:MAG: symmetrical bis(5'-nucleosyl)-tetraphosphatase [Burkholderiaceae bacterium]|nr:symmetrical bis(5'-nucleosyl)-tetraphosphatase [Burkholderiaceae bacterium]
MSMRSIWMVGDIQGCCSSLDELLAHPEIAREPLARFWFAGDLVNRGSQSLATLRRLMALEERSVAILGNHDLHLLAVAAGVRRLGKNDTLLEILEAPDSEELINWLRWRPLAHYELGHLMIHAGVLPKWDVQKTLLLANEVEQALRSPNWRKSLEKMYGNEPDHWKDGHAGSKRLRVIINALTRLRMCTSKGRMALSQKAAPALSQGDLMPWFDIKGRATQDVTVVFGHWSTLNLMLRDNAICLDTGCVWGGELTAVRLQDRRTVRIACPQSLAPGGN